MYYIGILCNCGDHELHGHEMVSLSGSCTVIIIMYDSGITRYRDSVLSVNHMSPTLMHYVPI